MPELFKNTQVNFGGAMTAQNGMLASANEGFDGVLMQNLQISYQQNVSRIYEIGQLGQTTNVYYVGGRASGNLSVAHVVGPGESMVAFYRNYSDVCQAASNTIQFSVGGNICPEFSDHDVKFLIKYCVLIQIGLSVAAQDFIINQSSNLMFSGLEYSEPLSQAEIERLLMQL